MPAPTATPPTCSIPQELSQRARSQHCPSRSVLAPSVRSTSSEPQPSSLVQVQLLRPRPEPLYSRRTVDERSADTAGLWMDRIVIQTISIAVSLATILILIASLRSDPKDASPRARAGVRLSVVLALLVSTVSAYMWFNGRWSVIPLQGSTLLLIIAGASAYRLRV